MWHLFMRYGFQEYWSYSIRIAGLEVALHQWICQTRWCMALSLLLRLGGYSIAHQEKQKATKSKVDFAGQDEEAKGCSSAAKRTRVKSS